MGSPLLASNAEPVEGAHPNSQAGGCGRGRQAANLPDKPCHLVIGLLSSTFKALVTAGKVVSTTLLTGPVLSAFGVSGWMETKRSVGVMKVS